MQWYLHTQISEIPRLFGRAAFWITAQFLGFRIAQRTNAFPLAFQLALQLVLKDILLGGNSFVELYTTLLLVLLDPRIPFSVPLVIFGAAMCFFPAVMLPLYWHLWQRGALTANFWFIATVIFRAFQVFGLARLLSSAKAVAEQPTTIQACGNSVPESRLAPTKIR
eukprot:m.325430 g.325430  ORF g.325430 m.325430 type:complete len:166 (+) comp55559_c0_seq5:694-1191(+)